MQRIVLVATPLVLASIAPAGTQYFIAVEKHSRMDLYTTVMYTTTHYKFALVVICFLLWVVTTGKL